MEEHHHFIRRCYELAASAVAKGNHPFGALLVHQGKIILEAENTVNTTHDATAHAEMNLLRLAAEQIPAALLPECILYTSTEPCMMCSGGMYWGGITKVVFGCAETTLAEYAGGDFLAPCRETFAKGKREIMVIGPVLEHEGAPLHASFW